MMKTTFKTTLFAASTALAFAANASEDVYTWQGDNTAGVWRDSASWTSQTATAFPDSDDVAILPDGTSILLDAEGGCVSNITIASGTAATLKTDAANASRIVYAREINGGGTLNLEGIYLYNRGDGNLTVDNDLVFAGNLENRIFKQKNASNIINGKLSSDPGAKLRFTTPSDAGNSSYYHKVNGDNSGYKGIVYIDGNNNDRFRFGSPESASENARWYFPGEQAGHVMNDFTGDATMKFGSFYTDKIKNDKSHLRFNSNGIITLEIGALNGLHNGQPVTDRITLTLGDANNAKERIVKVGTGTLQLGDTRHFNGTIISNGVVEAVHSAAMTKGTLTFDGGTLKYGPRLYTGDDAAWGSQTIKNSTGDVAIDTAGENVSYTTAIDASNIGGLVKKGDGTLDVQGYSTYAGKTIVSNGTLKVGFEYSSTTGIGGREFKAEEGATLDVTLNSRLTNAHANESALINILPDGAVVNLANNAATGIPRFTNAATFKGTVNFANKLDINVTNGAGGLVGSSSMVGSDDIDWGVTGEPENEHTRIFNIEGTEGMIANLGAFRLVSSNAMVYVKHRCEMIIGALGKDSVINGQIEVQDSKLFSIKSAGGKLTLGEKFAVLANGVAEYTRTPAINVTAGALENNADLSNFTVTLEDGVTLLGTGKWPDGIALPQSYNIPVKIGETTRLDNLDVDFANAVLSPAASELSVEGLDTGAEYELLVAKSISGFVPQLVHDTGKGRWRIVKRGNKLILKYFINGFVIKLR